MIEQKNSLREKKRFVLVEDGEMGAQVNEIEDAIVRVLQKHGVKRAGLFGSIVRGEATKESDIDLLVEFEGKKSLLDLAGLKIELEEQLKRGVDVLTYDSLHPLLREKILDEQEAIF